MSSTTVARVTTITARSPESFDAAVREGIARSHQTLRNVSGAWVKEQKVECTDGEITSYQVVLEDIGERNVYKGTEWVGETLRRAYADAREEIGDRA